MSFSRAVMLFLILIICVSAWAQHPAMSNPAISPDGKEISFVSGGDIWSVASAGGEAHLLVSDSATESNPLYSPDGRYLAFVSTRTGNGDIYVLELGTNKLTRLTYDDGFDQLNSWSPDSTWIYFSSSSHNISGRSDIYRVRRTGGTPMIISGERYVSEFFAAAAPDGKQIAFSARGMGGVQWWRHGHAHIDQGEIWLEDISSSTPKYTPLVSEASSKNLWPMWTPKGALYFMSDRDGSENVWMQSGTSRPTEVTHFTSGRVLWPSISADGNSIVFERDFSVWKLNTNTGGATPVAITLHGSPAGTGVEHKVFANGIRDMDLSPDGKKLAFIVHGEIFAVSAADGGRAIRITNTPQAESEVRWAPDSKRIAYISSRDGLDHIYLYDFPSEKETQLTSGSEDESLPQFSPDGKNIAFLRARKQLVVLDLESKQEKIIAKGEFAPPLFMDRGQFTWSPDSRWIACVTSGSRFLHNVSIAKADGSEQKPVSFFGNTNTGDINWSPDGKYLLVRTNQRTEDSDIVRIDLVPHTPRFHEDQFRDLFKEEKETPRTTVVPEHNEEPTQESPAGTSATAQVQKSPSDLTRNDVPEKKKEIKPVNINFDGIRDRLTILPVGIDSREPIISPDGKWMAFIGNAARQQNVYVYSLDELAKEPAVAKQLTATSGRKGSLAFDPKGKELYYTDDGKIFSVTIESPKPKPIAVSAEMDIDFDVEKKIVFEQGWRMLRDNFYDPEMNGADWKALHQTYLREVSLSANPDDMRRLMSLMIGELNSSHSGIRDGAQTKPETGHIGLFFDRAEFENQGKLKVTEVVELSPAGVQGIKVGDYVTRVDGIPVNGSTNLDALLNNKIDRRVSFTIARGTSDRTVTLKPVKAVGERELLYRAWVNHNRDFVTRVSGGRLGYVHMYDMSEDSLKRLYLDLDSENMTRQGVVIDIRNNNGGFVNAYALDALARRSYLTMTPRGFTPVPARTVLGQRALELPTILITNRNSLSDAEDFTEGYRTLNLGNVVGEPTAGWIIYTTNEALIDGSSERIPFMRVTDHEGKDMEMHPRRVDVEAQNPIGETLTGEDTQLRVAVRELLKQIEGESGTNTKSAGQ